MPFPLSPDIFDELCDLLPEAEGADLRSRDRTSYETHVAAYLAIRRSGERIPHRIRVAVVGALFACHDRLAHRADGPRP